MWRPSRWWVVPGGRSWPPCTWLWSAVRNQNSRPSASHTAHLSGSAGRPSAHSFHTASATKGGRSDHRSRVRSTRAGRADGIQARSSPSAADRTGRPEASMRRTFAWPRPSSPRPARPSERPGESSPAGAVGVPWARPGPCVRRPCRGRCRAVRRGRPAGDSPGTAVGAVGVVEVVVGLRGLDRDVPQPQVVGAGAVAEDADVFQLPLTDRRAVPVEDFLGAEPEGRRAFGTRACEGFPQLTLGSAADKFVNLPKRRRLVGEEILGVFAQGPGLLVTLTALELGLPVVGEQSVLRRAHSPGPPLSGSRTARPCERFRGPEGTGTRGSA